MALIAERLVINAVLAKLNTGTVTAYLSQGPSPAAPPTVVLHPLTGQYVGPLGNPDRDLVAEFQLTCIGETSEQAILVHDLTSSLILRTAVTGSGFVTHPMWQIPGTQQPVLRDDDLAEPLFYVTSQWIAHAIPN